MRFTSHGMRSKQNNIILEVAIRGGRQDGGVASGGSGSSIELIKRVAVLYRSEACPKSRYAIELR
jgi:hypothetical protein